MSLLCSLSTALQVMSANRAMSKTCRTEPKQDSKRRPKLLVGTAEEAEGYLFMAVENIPYCGERKARPQQSPSYIPSLYGFHASKRR